MKATVAAVGLLATAVTANWIPVTSSAPAVVTTTAGWAVVVPSIKPTTEAPKPTTSSKKQEWSNIYTSSTPAYQWSPVPVKPTTSAYQWSPVPVKPTTTPYQWTGWTVVYTTPVAPKPTTPVPVKPTTPVSQPPAVTTPAPKPPATTPVYTPPAVTTPKPPATTPVYTPPAVTTPKPVVSSYTPTAAISTYKGAAAPVQGTVGGAAVAALLAFAVVA